MENERKVGSQENQGTPFESWGIVGERLKKKKNDQQCRTAITLDMGDDSTPGEG